MSPTDRPDQGHARLHSWVPIRSLAQRHRERLLQHLLALGEEDRYLRFGQPASDAHIAHYVDTIDFARDEVFGVFNRKLQLIAVAHLAFIDRGTDKPPLGEFGVSVLPGARGRGYGARLFEHAVLHARNRGIDTLLAQALTANAPMLRIVRKAGAEIERCGTEAEATLKLPPETLATHIEQFVGNQAAEWDYRLKTRAKLIHDAFEAVTTPKPLRDKADSTEPG